MKNTKEVMIKRIPMGLFWTVAKKPYIPDGSFQTLSNSSSVIGGIDSIDSYGVTAINCRILSLFKRVHKGHQSFQLLPGEGYRRHETPRFDGLCVQYPAV